MYNKQQASTICEATILLRVQEVIRFTSKAEKDFSRSDGHNESCVEFFFLFLSLGFIIKINQN